MKIIKTFGNFGLISSFGSGNQFQSWIHIDDLVEIFLLSIKDKWDGIYNAVSPQPINQNKMMELISKGIINQYVTQVYKLIDAKKKYPRQSLMRSEEGIVLLEIVILNNGQLKSVKSIKAKFQRLVDSSFNAVEAAAPFPVFPKEITKKRMIIQVPVIYKIR